MRNHQGFTITELMVSIALMAVVIVWLMGFFVVQNRSYVVTDEVAEAQQNSRTILDLIEREIRAAGMLVPENGAACGVDNTNAPDILYVGDADAIDPTNQNVATLGAKVIAGLGTNTLTVNSIVLDGSPYYITTTPGVPSSDFRCDTGVCNGPNAVAGGVILIDAAESGSGRRVWHDHGDPKCHDDPGQLHERSRWNHIEPAEHSRHSRARLHRRE